MIQERGGVALCCGWSDAMMTAMMIHKMASHEGAFV